MREARFPTGAVELNYAEGPPSGPPLVVLHGGSARWQHYRAFLDVLAPTWHVYAPDLRGHGRSGRVPGRYRLREYVEDIAAFLRGVVSEPARLFGHSLGGEIAVMVAARHPELVRAVIVGDAPLWLERHPTEDRRHREMLLLWRALAASSRPVEAIAATLREMPVAVPGQAPTPARAGDVFGEESPWFPLMAESLSRLDPDMLSAVLAGPREMLAGYEGDILLPAIACPVLILQADPAVGGVLQDHDVARALRLLRHGTHVRLQGVGHELRGLHQDPLLEIVTRFLEAG